MNRIERLSAILTMLQSSSSVKTKHLSERFGIGLRTIYRDIRALEETGIPITGDSRSGYSLIDGFKLPPLMFSGEEAFAFLTAERLVDKFTDTGLRESYKSGVDKIRAVMRSEEKERIDYVTKNIGFLDFNYYTSKDSQNRLQFILDSISKRMKIIITYTSHSKNEKTQRTIDPIGVFFSMSNWYLVGFCDKRGDYRTFKINRIEELHHTDIPINKNHPPLDRLLEQLKDRTELQEALIEVQADNLPIIDDSKYYQGLVREIRKNNVIELHFLTFSIERLARWYMSFMDIATIIYPEELKQIANRIVSGYNTDSKRFELALQEKPT